MVEAYRADKALEIGVGSGLVTLTLAAKNRWTVGVDVDIEAVKKLRHITPVEVDLICCDSTEAFRDRVFDLVAFNPPYLPSEGLGDGAIEGGRGGIEVSKRWVEGAERVLKRGGRVVFVASSLSKRSELLRFVRELGFHVNVLKNMRLFFEELSVIEAKMSGSPRCRRPPV